MKKFMALCLAITSAFIMCACSGTSASNIYPVSREDGSGTRGAFVELFGIEQKNEEGVKTDYTTDMAEITNSTAVMMITIAGNKNSIGYISLGSLNENVKAVDIDSAKASVENIKNGSYKIARPFVIVTDEKALSDEAKDFISFILSKEGQAVVEAKGYISQGTDTSYSAKGTSGKITVAGSSSVTPVMEALKEEYVKLNPAITVEVQQSDSTTGIMSAAEGICDIGMSSRELKESEIESGVTASVIAMDGIAVIVNNENPVNSLTSEQVKNIFTGDLTSWEDIQGE